MKKPLVIVGVIAIFVSVGLSGCNQVRIPEKERFVGSWQNTTGYPSLIEFSKNGSCTFGAVGTWDLKDGKLVINIPDYNLNDTYNYAFSNNDKTLTLTLILNNYFQVWTKQ